VLAGIISKPYSTQGTKITNPKITGNNTVQQKLINWSKRILGNEALAQIMVKTKMELFIPKVRPYMNPSQREE